MNLFSNIGRVLNKYRIFIDETHFFAKKTSRIVCIVSLYANSPIALELWRVKVDRIDVIRVGVRLAPVTTDSLPMVRECMGVIKGFGMFNHCSSIGDSWGGMSTLYDWSRREDDLRCRHDIKKPQWLTHSLTHSTHSGPPERLHATFV